MKVILTQNVPKLGDSGTLQNVADGYARNYLIPQGMAQMATPGIVKQVEERQEAENRRIAKLEEEMRELGNQIEQTRLEMHANVGEHGRLFGSITSSDIAERLSEVLGEEIDRRKVELDAPIRDVGEYQVDVRLVGKLVPKLTVHVFDPDAPAESTETESESETEDTDTAEETISETDESGEATDEVETAS